MLLSIMVGKGAFSFAKRRKLEEYVHSKHKELHISIASYESHDNICFVANVWYMGLQEKNRKMIFDAQEICGKLGITEKEYERLRKKVKEEFPNDEMMFELHLLRALRSITKSRT